MWASADRIQVLCSTLVCIYSHPAYLLILTVAKVSTEIYAKLYCMGIYNHSAEYSCHRDLNRHLSLMGVFELSTLTPDFHFLGSLSSQEHLRGAAPIW